MFKAPRLILSSKRTVELPFIGSVGAGAHLTIISSPITYSFRIINAKMIFTEDANNLVTHEWLTSSNSSTSLTGRPSGENIFSKDAPTGTFIGKGIIRTVNTNIEIAEEGQYIKLYTYNGCIYAYDINASITIQEL